MGKEYGVYRLALLAFMTALCHIGRIAFQFLPNVQPVTAIVLILTLVMGTKDGLIVALLSILLSNITLGMGLWTMAQLTSYTVIVVITGLFRPFQQVRWFYMFFAIYAGLSGFAYGLIISLIQAPFLGISNFWAYYLLGLPFDFAHAIGNVVFYLLLAPILIPLLKSRLN